jgi:hypothetical protein
VYLSSIDSAIKILKIRKPVPNILSLFPSAQLGADMDRAFKGTYV